MSRNDGDAVEVRVAIRPTDSPAFGANPVESIAREIGTFGIAGQAIDGAALGIPGWIIARMIGDSRDSTILRYNADLDATIFDVGWEELRTHLESVFGGEVQVRDEFTEGAQAGDQDALFAIRPVSAAVLVVPVGDHLYGAIAGGLEAPLRRLTRGEYDIVERVDRASDDELAWDPTGGLLALSAGMGRTRMIALWRRGAISGVALLRKGGFTSAKVWGPTWQTIEPARADSPDLHEWVAEVVEDLGFGEPDISEFVAQFDLGNEATVHLRAQLRRLEPDFDELAKLLRLPSEAGQILIGAPAMIDRPGFEVFEPQSPRNLIRDEFNRVPTGPGFFDRIQRAAVQGSRWYIGVNLVFLAICVLTVGDTFRGRTPLWEGVLAGLLGTFTVVDHVLRIRVRRRRRQVSD